MPLLNISNPKRAIFFLVLLLVMFSYQAILIWIVGPRVMPNLASFNVDRSVGADRVALALDSVDKSISMLTSIGLGLFVIVGAAIGLDRAKRVVSTLDVVAIAVFLIAAMTSLYFGYLARMVALLCANSFAFPLTGADGLVGLQAAALAIEVSFATAVAALQLLAREKAAGEVEEDAGD